MTTCYDMNFRSLLKSLVVVALSILAAESFFFGWLAVFIPAFKTGITGLKTVGWISAPVVTSLGFTTGLWIGERIIQSRKPRFLLVWIWPLLGCSLGAAAVYWFGPMLIVFGMFVAGTVSVTAWEFRRLGTQRTLG